jgi:hypothetical protein
MNVLIGVDFFGAGNFGDDLMLAGFMSRLPDGISVTALTPHDRESQRRRFPAIDWRSDTDAARNDAVAQADLWLALGGTPFQLDSGPWLLDNLMRERERCAAHAVPMAYLGVGCESGLAARDARAVAVVSAAARVWTRDAFSAACLADVIPAGNLQAGADLAHLHMRRSRSPSLEIDLLGLLIAYEQKNLIPARALDDLIDERAPGTTRWLVQEGRTFAHTERWNYAALSASTQGRLEVMPFDYGRDSIPDFLERFGAAEVVLSTRYHGALVAAWHGSRVGVIARSAKLRALADDLGLVVAETIATADDLLGLIDRARTAPRERLDGASTKAEKMCADFFAWARGLPPRG